MLRTNSKKVSENIRDYIMQDKDYLIERNDGKELSTVDEYLTLAWNIFYDEKRYEIERNYCCASYPIFKDWASGLALGGLFCYYYNRSSVDDLGAILEETEEEKARYTEQQAEDLLTRLIFREIEKAWWSELRKSVKVS